MKNVYWMKHSAASGDLDFPALDFADKSARPLWMEALFLKKFDNLKGLAQNQRFYWRTTRIPFVGKGPDWVYVQAGGGCCSQTFWESLKEFAPGCEWIPIKTDRDANELRWGVIAGLPSAKVLDIAASGSAGPILRKAILTSAAECPIGLFTPNDAFDVFFAGNASLLTAAGLAMEKVGQSR